MRSPHGTITIEKWCKVDPEGRTGATATRALAVARHPGKVHEIQISRPGADVEYAERMDPSLYGVTGGPLRLEFEELMNREPGPGQHGVVIDEAELKELAVTVSGMFAEQ